MAGSSKKFFVGFREWLFSIYASRVFPSSFEANNLFSRRGLDCSSLQFVSQSLCGSLVASENLLWNSSFMSRISISSSEANVWCYRKRFFGGYPQLFSSTFVSQFLMVLCNKWVGSCFRKGSLEGSTNCSSLYRPPSFITSSKAAKACLGQIAGASEKLLGKVPPTGLYICSPVSYSTQCCVNDISDPFTPPLCVAVGVFSLG